MISVAGVNPGVVLFDQSKLYFQNAVVKSFLAGSVSGVCSTLLFQPLDLLKTRLQSPLQVRNGQAGLFTTCYNVVQSERFFGLWRGLVPSVLRCVPGIGLYFASLECLNSAIFNGADPSALGAVTLGATARTMTATILLPITVVKTRFESGRYDYKSVLHALSKIYTNEGRRGLFCGLSATLLRDAPFSGLYLMFYMQAKSFMATQDISSSYKSLANFSCGVTAGILSSLATHPADVVKTRMQITPLKHSSVALTCSSIYREKGLNGFFAGLVPRMARRTLMSAMAWTVYEQIIKQLHLNQS